MASVLLAFLIHAFDWFYASFLRIHFRDLEHTEKTDFLRFLEITTLHPSNPVICGVVLQKACILLTLTIFLTFF